MGIESGGCREELIEGIEVEFVGEHLNNDFWSVSARSDPCGWTKLTIKEVLLRKDIPALYDLLKERAKDFLVILQIDKLAETDQVASDQQLQLLSLLGPLFPLPGMPLVL